MAESSPTGRKHWENEKLLVRGSFSHCDFKRLVLQTLKNQGLFEKGLSCLSFRAVKTLNNPPFFEMKRTEPRHDGLKHYTVTKFYIIVLHCA